ncbi:MAG TPA: hypothetical protein VLH94_04110 [Spirochaetia bacterium]|nr:hypothetical protein [Spirochaetia bacterium]
MFKSKKQAGYDKVQVPRQGDRDKAPFSTLNEKNKPAIVKASPNKK